MVEAAFGVLKISVAIAIGAVFLIAINFILSLITTLVFGNVVGEFLIIVSNCLPFDALAVFGSIGLSVAAIASFLVAKKIFDLTSWTLSSI